jgi:hypothetical protein
MRSCPTCNRAFDDDELTVCPDDGSALAGAPELPTTESDSGLGGKATWNPSQDQLAEIQQSVAAITTTDRPRKTSPWLVAAVAILILLGVAWLIAFVALRL